MAVGLSSSGGEASSLTAPLLTRDSSGAGGHEAEAERNAGRSREAEGDAGNWRWEILVCMHPVVCYLMRGPPLPLLQTLLASHSACIPVCPQRWPSQPRPGRAPQRLLHLTSPARTTNPPPCSTAAADQGGGRGQRHDGRRHRGPRGGGLPLRVRGQRGLRVQPGGAADPLPGEAPPRISARIPAAAVVTLTCTLCMRST